MAKKFLTVLLVTFAIVQNVNSQTNEVKIKETALNYIEGWYTADTLRMNKALANNLTKRGFVYNKESNKIEIWEATKPQMMEWTALKPNEFETNLNTEIKIEIIEVGQNIAMVKTITPQYIDYIHMGKFNNEWKIYNVIWEFNPKFTPNHKQ